MKILTLCPKCVEEYQIGGYKVSALRLKTKTEKKPRCEHCRQHLRYGLEQYMIERKKP